MTYDTSFNGRVYDTETGHELVVTDGKVVARVLPDHEWMVDAQTGVAITLAPGQTYAISGSGHPVVLNPDQEWVEMPVSQEYPAGGFVRTKTTTPAPTPAPEPEGAPA